jgi:hypothetical protein
MTTYRVLVKREGQFWRACVGPAGVDFETAVQIATAYVATFPVKIVPVGAHTFPPVG